MLIDKYGRRVDYLRISVTERCNFRCQYCMPEKPFSWVPRENLLNYEELFKFIKIAIDEGINKIRITGGEPLLRENLDRFIAMIYEHKNNIDLALTTNGFLLKDVVQKLKSAGLKRINVSLDSLKPEVANFIAQKEVLNEILLGIKKANEVGLKVKINTVIMQNINEAEIIDLFEFAKAHNMPIRYIEYMENSFANSKIKGVKTSEILDKISQKYKFEKMLRDNTSPAQYFKCEDGYIFGVIEPYKDDFCKSCNRIRLTAEGHLIPCLYFDEAMSIKEAIKSNDIQKASEIFKEVIANKPEKNRWGEDVSSRAFFETGG